MNKKGFTLVELITTFALASVILILLINVVVLIKDIYTKSDIKTQLLIGQANLSNSLNSKIRNGNLNSYSECSDSTDFCYDFSFKDGNSIKLKVTNSEVIFGNFVYKVKSGTKILTPSLTDTLDFLVIEIPIENKLYPNEDFGINLVYRY